jgi:glycerate dehydrogenase
MPSKESSAVFLDLESMDRGDLDLSGLKATVPDWHIFPSTSDADTLDRIGDAEIVVSNKVILDRPILEQARSLKLICVAATGTNNVDLQAARERGISVCNVRAYATSSVVQHTFALILALAIHLPEYTLDVRTGRWQESRQFCLLDHPIHELTGKTLGIVGYGELGRAVAHAARIFDMKILVAARKDQPAPPGRTAFDELLAQADVLSLHCPLTDETRGLIGERELDLMKDDSLLINTARGGIVDESALAMALRNGRIGGAGIDVLAQEPPTAVSPLLADGIPNLIVTPHIAWASQASRQRLLDGVAANIRAWLRGEPQNLV